MKSYLLSIYIGCVPSMPAIWSDNDNVKEYHFVRNVKTHIVLMLPDHSISIIEMLLGTILNNTTNVCMKVITLNIKRT